MLQTQSSPKTEGRIVACDNFYTGKVKTFTSGEITLLRAVLRTVLFNNLDALNRSAVKNATKHIEDQPKGSWYLYQAFDVTSEGLKRKESVP